jgi:hypothetical protein
LPTSEQSGPAPSLSIHLWGKLRADCSRKREVPLDKSQAPNPKSQRIPKSQTPNWSLDIGSVWDLQLGAWDLTLMIRRFR